MAGVVSVEQLAGMLKQRGRLLGLDLGTRTIGLAMSDVERHIATPLETLRRTKFTDDVTRLADVMGRYEIAALVVGLPRNMDGSEGPRSQATRDFVRRMSGRLSATVTFWDERLSTSAVTRSLIEQDVSRAKRALVVDRMAAAYILQGVLDRLRRLANDAATVADSATNY